MLTINPVLYFDGMHHHTATHRLTDTVSSIHIVLPISFNNLCVWVCAGCKRPCAQKHENTSNARCAGSRFVCVCGGVCQREIKWVKYYKQHIVIVVKRTHKIRIVAAVGNVWFAEILVHHRTHTHRCCCWRCFIFSSPIFFLLVFLQKKNAHPFTDKTYPCAYVVW